MNTDEFAKGFAQAVGKTANEPPAPDLERLIGQMIAHYQIARDLEKKTREQWSEVAATGNLLAKHGVSRLALEDMVQTTNSVWLAVEIGREYAKLRGVKD